MTGFSPDKPKRNRPYVVIDQLGTAMVRVVPQSTVGDVGVHIPAGAVECLEEGWFVPWSRAISVRRVASRPMIGRLPDEYLKRVLAQWRGR